MNQTAIFDHECPHDMPLCEIRVQFTGPDAGWIWCQVEPLHDQRAISCSCIWDPFPRFITWLEQIAAGSTNATWVVDQEGSCSRLLFLGGNASVDDRSDYLIHLRSNTGLDRIRGVRVDRRQLVASFYTALRSMPARPDYKAREWERHPHIPCLDELEDEDYTREYAAFPYTGVILRSLRSPAIEAWLQEDPA